MDDQYSWHCPLLDKETDHNECFAIATAAEGLTPMYYVPDDVQNNPK